MILLFFVLFKQWARFKEFGASDFDYIIVDEAHHCASKSYNFIFEYFQPKILLGLISTPERFDGKDIYERFDNNIAINIRLKDALELDLLCPFNYFGVSDLQSIDFSNIDISKIENLEKILMVEERTDLIVEKLKFYSNPFKKLKCLAFCASVKHAKYMASQFNELGINSVSLDGSDEISKRTDYINKLSNGEIEVIFCRDIFNEGIDIPEINTILMLRPTESPTIFIQQLGRGLRKYKDKEFLTIIDFIGNHKNIFNLALSFGADKLYDKDNIRNFVSSDFNEFSKFAFFKIDKIAKEKILQKIDSINLESISWLKNIYISFKKSFLNVKNKFPLWLDYLNSDSAPNITKFIKASPKKTYYSFLKHVINENSLNDLTDKEYRVLKTFESFLPLKRNYEFIILKEIFKNSYFDINNFNNTIFVNFSNDSFKNSINNLLLKHLDKKELNLYGKIVDLKEDKIYFSKEVIEMFQNDFLKNYINELIVYGLKEYEMLTPKESFNKLVINEKYSRNQALMMFNYDKTYSSFREGFKMLKNNFLLFVNLDKDEMTNEAHKYKDGFIDRITFQWETQNTTSISSVTGRSIINHKEMGNNLHLFVRKNKKDNGSFLPYYYLGKATVVRYEGDKPIKFILKLEKLLPNDIYKIFN